MRQRRAIIVAATILALAVCAAAKAEKKKKKIQVIGGSLMYIDADRKVLGVGVDQEQVKVTEDTRIYYEAPGTMADVTDGCLAHIAGKVADDRRSIDVTHITIMRGEYDHKPKVVGKRSVVYCQLSKDGEAWKTTAHGFDIQVNIVDEPKVQIRKDAEFGDLKVGDSVKVRVGDDSADPPTAAWMLIRVKEIPEDK